MPGCRTTLTSTVPSLKVGRKARGNSEPGEDRDADGDGWQTDDEGRALEAPFEARFLPALQYAHETGVVLGQVAHARQQPIGRAPA